MARQVLKDIDKLLPELEQTLQQKDCEQLRKLYHSAKGLALNGSCHELAKIAEKLEVESKAAKLKEVQDGHESFLSTAKATAQALEKFLKHSESQNPD